MNQTQPVSPAPKGKSSALKWLLIILGFIIVLGGGYLLYAKYGKPSSTATEVLPSPTPSVSASVTPTASSGNNQKPTATASTPTNKDQGIDLPSGYKLVEGTMGGGCPHFGISFGVPQNYTVGTVTEKAGATDLIQYAVSGDKGVIYITMASQIFESCKEFSSARALFDYYGGSGTKGEVEQLTVHGLQVAKGLKQTYSSTPSNPNIYDNRKQYAVWSNSKKHLTIHNNIISNNSTIPTFDSNLETIVKTIKFK